MFIQKNNLPLDRRKSLGFQIFTLGFQCLRKTNFSCHFARGETDSSFSNRVDVNRSISDASGYLSRSPVLPYPIRYELQPSASAGCRGFIYSSIICGTNEPGPGSGRKKRDRITPGSAIAQIAHVYGSIEINLQEPSVEKARGGRNSWHQRETTTCYNRAHTCFNSYS